MAASAPAAKPPGLDSTQLLAFLLLDLVIILVVARLVGSFALRLGQPRVVGEIVGGVLLGPTLLGATIYTWGSPFEFLHCDRSLGQGVPGASGVSPSITSCVFPPQAQSVLSLFGQLALLLFMFLVGLELNLDQLKGKGRAVATLSVGSIGVPLALGFVLGPILFDRFAGSGNPSSTAFSLFVGAMLSVTAFPVMARILQEKGLITTDMGASGVAAAAVVTIGMFLLLSIAQGVASNASLGSMLLRVLGTVVLLVVLMGAVRPALAWMARSYQAGGPLTPDLFAVCVIVTLATSFAAHQIGINVIVGGFLAGIAMPVRGRLFKELAPRLNDVVIVFLLPIFLAFSGLRTDFTKLGLADVPYLILFVLVGVVAKWGGGALFARLGGLSWREGNLLGILMNCRGLLVLVVALIAFQSNAITAQLQVGGVLMALVTTIMTGPLIDVFLPGKTGEAEPMPEETVMVTVPSPSGYHSTVGPASAIAATDGGPARPDGQAPIPPPPVPTSSPETGPVEPTRSTTDV